MGNDRESETTTITNQEQLDLLETLAKHRGFLRFTVQGLTDEQAAARPTVSELCLGGLIKHVAETESSWVDFILHGPAAMTRTFDGGGSVDGWQSRFQLAVGETLAGVLAEYDRVAHHTDRIVAGLADLDAGHPLPIAPWFEQGAHWSARRVLLHLIAETAQHAGHADIIRETLDGSRTMG